MNAHKVPIILAACSVAVTSCWRAELELAPTIPIADDANITLTITISEEGIYSVDGERVTLVEIEDLLTTQIREGIEPVVVVRGEKEASITPVIELLDLCQKHKVMNIAFTTTQGHGDSDQETDHDERGAD